MINSMLCIKSEDGFTYLFDIYEHVWYQVTRAEGLPPDVLELIKSMQEKTNLLKGMMVPVGG